MRNSRVGLGAALVAVLALVLGACGGSSGDSDGASAGAVDKNATLNVGFPVPALPLDPQKAASDLAVFPYASLLYDRLTQIKAGPKVEPMIATKWEFAADGMSVDFTLRDDVTFSDGAKLDAAAVKASLDRAISDPASTVAPRFEMVKSVDAVDATTVKITTNRKAADLPYVLAGAAGAIISPKALNNKDLDKKPVGSGPYTLKELKLGQSATFERRDGYWNPEDGLAKTIKIVTLTDSNAQVNALRSGQVDMILSKPGQPKFGNDYVHYTYPAGAGWSLFLNTKASKPLADVKVRQALNYAVDRKGIIDSLLAGQCEANVQPLAKGTVGYVDSPPIEYTHDVAKAKQLLADAGYADGFSIDLLVGAGLTPQGEIATALQAQLAEIGVKVKIDEQDPGQTATLYSQKGYDTMVQSRVGASSPLQNLATNFANARNFPGSLPAEFTQAITAASDPTLSASESKAALEEASSVANEQALDLFICNYGQPIDYKNTLVGTEDMGPLYYSGLWDLRQVGVKK